MLSPLSADGDPARWTPIPLFESIEPHRRYYSTIWPGQAMARCVCRRGNERASSSGATDAQSSRSLLLVLRAHRKNGGGRRRRRTQRRSPGRYQARAGNRSGSDCQERPLQTQSTRPGRNRGRTRKLRCNCCWDWHAVRANVVADGSIPRPGRRFVGEGGRCTARSVLRSHPVLLSMAARK
jgi:hypothetical protein